MWFSLAPSWISFYLKFVSLSLALREGALKLRRGKTKQEDILPLPKKLGEAIVDYCRNGRPTTAVRSIFVYHRAPFGKSICSHTVRGAIRRGYQRAGFSKIPSTHILRHSLATQMLQSGAKLKDIADILRHRCIDTTMIYTKVDFIQLSRVVMPWIGGKFHE